ncbi:MAG: hypothetical protein U9O49_03945 [Candidatus Thermoplasmatota archaeon]|nr:hypothetical protein [Candidatus Thermoplasmatota archaeon]
MSCLFKCSKRSIAYAIILLFLISTFCTSGFSAYTKTNTDMAFKQEIAIPIDTSLKQAGFQPIDMRVEFDSPCWAKNEQEHSVRIVCDDGSELIELESQIYDLEHSDDAHIESCSLVFLIPDAANGEEKYYVCYDSSETESPNYEDHLSVEDTHYFYEPIPGQIIDFDYYKIIENGYIVYGVCQKGELLGEGMFNAAIKLKPNSTEFETVYAEQIAAFSMSYSIDPAGEKTGTQLATDVSKNILEDGNLMVRLQIGGMSPGGELKTDDIYTYYYSPTSTKRLNVNVNHEVLKTCDIKGDMEKEGTYASLSTIKARSATIEKMNMGDILPFIHFHSEDGSVKEYSIPTDPDVDPAEWILSSTDDDDLGSKAWMCMSDPLTGQAHGLIFESSTGFLEGEDDGIQIKSSIHQHVKLPGLEADSGDLYAVRNAYEDGKHNTVLLEGTNVVFNTEFITFQKGGYEAIDAGSELYQELVRDRPINRENVSDKEVEEIERYQLTTFVHLSPSFPMGSLLSAALGKNFPYIYAELYRDNDLKSSGSVGRLSLASMDLDFEGKKLFEKIKTAVGMFDWRNASFFKKVVFPDLEAGTYVVKIFRENPLLGEERKYIGFAIVDLEETTTTHAYCRPEGSIEVSINDQQNEGVENVEFSLLKDDLIIADTTSDENGTTVLKAPCFPREPYILKVIYQGFLVDEKQVVFSFKNSLKPLEESYSIALHQLELSVKDTWGLPPEVEVNPKMTSADMVEPISIISEKQGGGKYLFTGLYPAEYVLSMNYKSFSIEKAVSVGKDGSIRLIFPAEHKAKFHMLNSYGGDLDDGDVVLSRGGEDVKETIDKNGNVSFLVPPGEYELTVRTDNKEIAQQKIAIKSDKVLNVLTGQESQFHSMITILGVLLAGISIVIFFLWKRDMYRGIKLLMVALLVVALVSPWWILTGDSGTTSTTTKTLLIPSKIVTLTSSSNVLGGEVSSVPAEFAMVLGLLSMLICVSCLLIGLTLLTKNKFRKTTMTLETLSIIMLILSVVLFFYTMSMVTEVGLGSFMGNGDIETTLPGIAGSEILACSWGAGTGFYLAIISVICLIFIPIYNRFKK